MGGTQPRFLLVPTSSDYSDLAVQAEREGRGGSLSLQERDFDCRMQKVVLKPGRGGVMICMDSHPQYRIGATDEGELALEARHNLWEVVVLKEKDMDVEEDEWRDTSRNFLDADRCQDMVFLVMLRNKGTSLCLKCESGVPELATLEGGKGLDQASVSPFLWQMPYAARNFSSKEVGCIVAVSAVSLATCGLFLAVGSECIGDAGAFAGGGGHGGSATSLELVESLKGDLTALGKTMGAVLQEDAWREWLQDLEDV